MACVSGSVAAGMGVAGVTEPAAERGCSQSGQPRQTDGEREHNKAIFHLPKAPRVSFQLPATQPPTPLGPQQGLEPDTWCDTWCSWQDTEVTESSVFADSESAMWLQHGLWYLVAAVLLK